MASPGSSSFPLRSSDLLLAGSSEGLCAASRVQVCCLLVPVASLTLSDPAASPCRCGWLRGCVGSRLSFRWFSCGVLTLSEQQVMEGERELRDSRRGGENRYGRSRSSPNCR